MLLELRRVEMSSLSQRQQFARDREGDGSLSGDAQRAAGAAAAGVLRAASAKPQRNVPVLELKLFGRFAVSIGGAEIEPQLFRRQNVRALLVLLAIQEGRDISRDAIIREIWPQATEKVARKAFYAAWSQLKHNLTLADGSCPYLVRHQYGCSLDAHHVQSDIMRLADICRELQFGRPDVGEWAVLYDELDRDFSNELMPSETTLPLVAQARAKYTAKLVDALISAAQGMVAEGSPQWGIWFARMAKGHDRLREDAYVALMRAQIAAEQRTAAIMTFFECQRVLADELGVDPSPETMALYESLLD